MDVPYDRIICASNDNKVLHDFFETGIYDLRKRPLTKTISPAIDILVSSNLERLLWIHLGMKRAFWMLESMGASFYFVLDLREQIVCINKILN